jgi:hypothetical protein
VGDDEDREGHEEVTSLLDLQAKLRGEAEDDDPESAVLTTEIIEIPEAGDGESTPPASNGDLSEPETSDVPVLVTPDPEGAAERDEFAPVTTLPVGASTEPRLIALSERLARIEQEMARVTDRAGSTTDPREDRIVVLEQRLLHEVGSQRADLLQMIHDRLDRLETTIAEALRDLRARSDETDGDEPA